MKKRTIAKKKPKTKVLSHARGLQLYRLVEADVKNGDTIREACAKHNFPVYKYTYWRKQVDEGEAIDKMVDKYNLLTDQSGEILHDSSSLAVRDRLARIDELSVEAKDQGVRAHSMANKLTVAQLENEKLKQRLALVESKLLDYLLKESK